ncbi:hypothetical protein PLESTB_000277500 [Pleodorina starrii]|uniref:Pherophorin domain-containing protein n=1 Tax=Pleodorina starrii TaxID=330485 RepID=A0A9W6BDS8_9CHLO|nr:hypothetical protein PLESTB_000277500 [Pleodorina starrii]
MLFRTDVSAVVGNGVDSSGARYTTARSTHTISLPATAMEIIVSDCCRVGGLVGASSLGSLEFFRFSTMYVPGVLASISTQAPAVVVINKAAPGAYEYTFVPSISSHGDDISCAINTALAGTAPGELTAEAVPGGCRIGWRNGGYPVRSKIPVGLRISENSTGHYNDITFLMISADTSGAPVVKAVTTDNGQQLPQTGGTVNVKAGTEVQVTFQVSDADAGATIDASSTTLPPGAKLTKVYTSSTVTTGRKPAKSASPPPPHSFNWPFHTDCDVNHHNIETTPIRVSSLLGPFNETEKTASYCLLISTNATAAAEAAANGTLSEECADMKAVRRVDIVVAAECAKQTPKASRSVTINGLPTTAGFSITVAQNGAAFGLMSVRRINQLIPKVPARGLYLCMALDKDSSCGTPESLCYGSGCTFQVLSPDFKCCPTGEAPY